MPKIILTPFLAEKELAQFVHILNLCLLELAGFGSTGPSGIVFHNLIRRSGKNFPRFF
jgi:hypothetical protein